MLTRQIQLLQLSRRGRSPGFMFFSVLAAQQHSCFNLLNRRHKITHAVMWRQNLWTAHPEQGKVEGHTGTMLLWVPLKRWHELTQGGSTATYTGVKWTFPFFPSELSFLIFWHLWFPFFYSTLLVQSERDATLH